MVGRCSLSITHYEGKTSLSCSEQCLGSVHRRGRKNIHTRPLHTQKMHLTSNDTLSCLERIIKSTNHYLLENILIYLQLPDILALCAVNSEFQNTIILNQKSSFYRLLNHRQIPDLTEPDEQPFPELGCVYKKPNESTFYVVIGKHSRSSRKSDHSQDQLFVTAEIGSQGNDYRI